MTTRDRSRLYGIASTFEGERAVPTPEARPLLAAQRRKLMSKDSKVGETHYGPSRWVPIPCLTADLIRQHPEVRPTAGLTDLDGTHGEPQIYTEWSIPGYAPVMREWRYPSLVPGERDLRPCEHLAYDNTWRPDDD